VCNRKSEHRERNGGPSLSERGLSHGVRLTATDGLDPKGLQLGAASCRGETGDRWRGRGLPFFWVFDFAVGA
jgi:hypothetical protein